MRFAAFLVLMLFASGCGKSAARFDTSSQKAFEMNRKIIRMQLNPAEQKLLDEAFRNWVFTDINKNDTNAESLSWKAIQQKTTGKTAKQVIADYQTFLADETAQKIKRVLENEPKIQIGFSEQQVVELLGEPGDREILNGKETLYYMTADSKKHSAEHPVIGDVVVFIEGDKVSSSGRITKITTP